MPDRARFKTRSVTTALLLSTLTGAALVAWFSRHRPPERPSASPAATPHAAAKSTAPSLTAHSRSHAVSSPPVLRPVPSVLPTPQEVEARREPPIAVDPKVRDGGLDELLGGPLKCMKPSFAVETGRSQPGGVGCAVRGAEGRLVRVGHWVLRREDGQLSAGDFENGVRVGKWTIWFKNGIKSQEGQFVDDQRDGVWRTWDETGRLVLLQTFDHGRLSGVSISWMQQGPGKAELWRGGMRILSSPDVPASAPIAPSEPK